MGNGALSAEGEAGPTLRSSRLDENGYVQGDLGLQWADIPAGFVLQTQKCRVSSPQPGRGPPSPTEQVGGSETPGGFEPARDDVLDGDELESPVPSRRVDQPLRRNVHHQIVDQLLLVDQLLVEVVIAHRASRGVRVQPVMILFPAPFTYPKP